MSFRDAYERNMDEKYGPDWRERQQGAKHDLSYLADPIALAVRRGTLRATTCG